MGDKLNTVYQSRCSNKPFVLAHPHHPFILTWENCYISFLFHSSILIVPLNIMGVFPRESPTIYNKKAFTSL
jgi:hypothetical protein